MTHSRIVRSNAVKMGKNLLSLLLVVTQLMSWASTPLYLCISENGCVCFDVGSDSCTCCTLTVQDESDVEQSACCGHCDADEVDELQAIALTTPCDCTHIPLTIEQSESVQPANASTTIIWDAQVFWCSAQQQIIPRTMPVVLLHWDRRDNPARHPVALATTVLRC